MSNPQPGRIPAIDGLRGLAVLLVMAYHFDVGLPGGFIGVDVFFAISGFVVARRLLHQLTAPEETVSSSSTKGLLKAFYFGRFWRLFPALGAMVAVVVGVSLFMDPVLGNPRRNLANGLAALVGLANWFRLLHPDQAGEIARPLLHTWSLSIEEQFYVCLPILLAVFRRKARTAAYVIGVFCVAASVLPLPSGDPNERYFFTLARLAPLGFGVLLAAYFHGREPGLDLSHTTAHTANHTANQTSNSVAAHSDARRRTPTLVDVVFCVLGLLLVPMLRQATWNDRSLFPLGLILIGLLSAGVLGLLTLERTTGLEPGSRSGVVSGALESRPAQFLGSRSYSLYLWHFPIAHLFVSQPRLMRTLAWVALSLLAAELSYRFVETPSRRRNHPKRDH